MKYTNSRVVVYEGPKSLKDARPEDLIPANEERGDCSLMHSTSAHVSVNGQDLYVYETMVNYSRSWNNAYLPPLGKTPMTYFDFEGKVRLSVTMDEFDIEKVTLSPLSYGIEPRISEDGHSVEFELDHPDNYTLTFNDSPERAVHIFTNSPEDGADIPDPDDPSVIYIGPGEWDIECIMLKKGQTLYLAGGAVVHGIVNANFENDIRVCGRGIIDGSSFEGWKGNSARIPLKFDHCDDLTIKDVIVLGSNAWCLQGYDNQRGLIDGVRIISARPNSDGITLQSVQDYTVRNAFVRSWDDSLVVKNYDRNSENISFENTQIWTDLAQSMEIGYETNKGKKADAYIRNITFKDITVLNNYHKPAISIHNADDADISDIVFDNITIEHEEIGSGDGSQMPYLIDLWVCQSGNWSTTIDRGNIHDVVIRNVKVLSGNDVKCRLKGYDEEHTITGVEIENVNILGKDLTISDFVR
ncbi:glycosyl hydrolase family 28 protein [Butyrivibrio sp. MC2013]|uniref:glycosyl hydrolase family 28 protein n=1 Tax=Butyrivibrio sp. MC2013 TaxID=1280686 RepID=UPI0018C9E231|nr:glycosyl hydrolase family 28 protein [Butyrivibrio sp. MC2013]